MDISYVYSETIHVYMDLSKESLETAWSKWFHSIVANELILSENFPLNSIDFNNINNQIKIPKP